MQYAHKACHKGTKIQLKYHSVFTFKEIQTSRKGKLEYVHSSFRENQLIYQIPTRVSSDGIQRSELCLYLLLNPVKYIPVTSQQHRNCFVVLTDVTA